MSTQGAWREARDGKLWVLFASARCLIAKSSEGNLRHPRAKGYRDFILTDPSNPFISGTDVPRLRPMHLGVKSVGVSEDEIQRVVVALQHFYASKPLSASVPTRRRSRHTATSRRPTSARRPMSECLTQTPPLNRFAVPEAMPAASVDNRTVGKTTAGVPQPSQKDRDNRPDTKGLHHELIHSHPRRGNRADRQGCQ